MENKETSINPWLQLVIIICVVGLSAAVISHSIVACMKIETSFGGHGAVGPERSESSVFMAGSSLAGDGLSWKKISDVLNLRIESWGVAGSSPSEWERFQDLATQANLTILVVSTYDLNEYLLSDFRAEVAPLGQTIKDLWQSRADWSYSKRLLSLYPLTYLRVLYPTAGRSDGVMVGAREELRKMVRTIFPIESEAGPTLSLNETAPPQEYKKEKISDWSPGRTLRRLASMRSACQGKHTFNGPKSMAFLRMLREAQKQGRTVVVVLPVSPVYAKEFLNQEVKREFEEALNEAQHSVPETHWIRLDQLSELNSNDYFWDLVHMNSYGQKVATEAFVGQFREYTSLK